MSVLNKPTRPRNFHRDFPKLYFPCFWTVYLKNVRKLVFRRLLCQSSCFIGCYFFNGHEVRQIGKNTDFFYFFTRLLVILEESIQQPSCFVYLFVSLWIIFLALKEIKHFKTAGLSQFFNSCPKQHRHAVNTGSASRQHRFPSSNSDICHPVKHAVSSEWKCSQHFSYSLSDFYWASSSLYCTGLGICTWKQSKVPLYTAAVFALHK